MERQSELINQDTNISTNVSTNRDGEFTVPYLEAGKYKVVITKEGFKGFEKADYLYIEIAVLALS